MPPVFPWLQKLGEVDDDEMYRVFNMGIGLVLVVSPYYAESIQQQLAEGRPCELADRPGGGGQSGSGLGVIGRAWPRWPECALLGMVRISRGFFKGGQNSAEGFGHLGHATLSELRCTILPRNVCD